MDLIAGPMIINKLAIRLMVIIVIKQAVIIVIINQSLIV